MVFDLIEEYANTGFYKLKQFKEELHDDSNFMLKLLNDMDQIQKEYLKNYQISAMIEDDL